MSTEFQIIHNLIKYKMSRKIWYKEIQIEILKNLIDMLDVELKITKNKQWQDEHKKPLY